MSEYLGYGVEFDEKEFWETKAPALIEFIKNHKKTLSYPEDKAIVNAAMNLNLDDALLEMEFEQMFYEGEGSGNKGLFAIVSNVMRRETDIDFEYFDADDSRSDTNESAIMLAYKMPWDYSEKERLLSKDVLDEIFRTYLNELSLDYSLRPICIV